MTVLVAFETVVLLIVPNVTITLLDAFEGALVLLCAGDCELLLLVWEVTTAVAEEQVETDDMDVGRGQALDERLLVVQ